MPRSCCRLGTLLLRIQCIEAWDSQRFQLPGIYLPHEKIQVPQNILSNDASQDFEDIYVHESTNQFPSPWVAIHPPKHPHRKIASNSVNVFLGIGLPWSIAALYWSAQKLREMPASSFQVEFYGIGTVRFEIIWDILRYIELDIIKLLRFR